MMFYRLLKTELKQAIRDPLYQVFLFYPVILALLALLLKDVLSQQPKTAYLLVLSLFVLMGGFIFGALIGFSLLDDKDDFVLISLKTSPLGVRTYVIYKLLIGYFFGLISTLMMLASFSLFEMPWYTIIYVTLLSSLQGPIIALIISVFASNKVEGFVIMKSAGLLLIAPIISLFVEGWQEVFLYLIPGFFPLRLLLSDVTSTVLFLGNPLYYFLLGLIVELSILSILFILYQKKLKKIS
ncbi:MAG TPA: hypothetical protein DEA45_02445 [Acholeplasmataceae bacterium]|nr:hypothetical protein [Acholeplasmataceae bacterium]